MWATALQIVHVSHAGYALKAFSGWAFGVFYLPDKVPWYDAVGLFRSTGYSLELSLGHGSPTLHAQFKEDGPILALNLVACLLLIGFLKNLERLEEASERKSAETAGKAESPGT